MKSCVLIALALACAAEAFIVDPTFPHKVGLDVSGVNDLWMNNLGVSALGIGNLGIGALGIGDLGVGACGMSIAKCMKPLIGYHTKYISPNALFHISKHPAMFTGAVDKICIDMGEIKQCLAMSHTACSTSPEMTKHVMALTKLFEYICSPKGKTTIMALTNSECVANPMKLAMYGHTLLACHAAFQTGVQQFLVRTIKSGAFTWAAEDSQMCPLVDEFKTCTIVSSHAMCGPEFGEFLKDFWKMVGTFIFSDTSCIGNFYHAHRFLTHTVPYMHAAWK